MAKDKSTRPVVGVFIGDTHSGSDIGLAPRKFWLESKERFYPLSRDQEWLLKCFGDFAARVKALKDDYTVAAFLGGDLTDGVQHHGSIETVGNRGEQIDMAVEALRPIWSIAAACYVTYGTRAHVGENGDADRSVAKEIGAKRGRYWRLKVGGRILDWAHHGASVGRRPWTESNGLVTMANMEYWEAARRGMRPADLVVRHHRHMSPKPATVNGVTAAICPCWQMPTDYVYQFAPGNWPSIGGLLWFTDSGLVEPVLYETPRKVEVMNA